MDINGENALNAKATVDIAADEIVISFGSY